MPSKRLHAHPAADAWPMLGSDDLQALADDIAENGLRHPIVVTANADGEKVILDGRNRYEACRIAKVEPDEVVYDGDDPVGFVLSENEHRRHMTKGQRAMAIARMLVSSGNTIRGVAESYGVSAPMIGKASTVLEWVPDLADAVVNGDVPLNAAYEEARDAKDAASEADAKRRKLERDMTKLRDIAADLADEVDAGRLALSEALAAAEQRKRDEIDEADRYLSLMGTALNGWFHLLGWYRGETIPLVDERMTSRMRKQLDEIKKEMQEL